MLKARNTLLSLGAALATTQLAHLVSSLELDAVLRPLGHRAHLSAELWGRSVASCNESSRGAGIGATLGPFNGAQTPKKVLISMLDIQDTAKGRRAARVAVTLLRLAVGAIFLARAWEKLSDMTGTVTSFARVGVPYPFGSAYLATAGELLGGVGLVLGVLTPLAASAPILTTALAIYFLHGESGFDAASGGWEYPSILLLVCFYFATHGPGPYSMDAVIGRQRPRFRRRHRHVVSG